MCLVKAFLDSTVVPYLGAQGHKKAKKKKDKGKGEKQDTWAILRCAQGRRYQH
jgi:hypothetical protein